MQTGIQFFRILPAYVLYVTAYELYEKLVFQNIHYTKPEYPDFRERTYALTFYQDHTDSFLVQMHALLHRESAVHHRLRSLMDRP